MSSAQRVVYRWDAYFEPNEDDMQFRLVYEGPLLSHRDDEKLKERSLHVHSIRKKFHTQLAKLWTDHPVLANGTFNKMGTIGSRIIQTYDREGFLFKPLVDESNGLICALDILLLRDGKPGHTLADIDNRLKTIFDALRMPKGPQELGADTKQGKQTPGAGENPFYVVMEDDKLITHLSVSTDTLLHPVPDTPIQDAVRLIIEVTIRPYFVSLENLVFT
jgi:hypothetical protein